MRLFIFGLALFIFQVDAVERIVCNSSYSRILYENDIIFFESPNFPESINKESKQKCQLKFYGKSNKKNMTLIFAVTNGHPVGGQIFDNGYNELLEFPLIDYYQTFNDSLIFSFANFEIRREWEGFQGYIAYEKFEDNGCPLANKKEYFKFENESEVFYLRSSYYWHLGYDIYNGQKKECVWKFLAPDGYTFKILSLIADSRVLIYANNQRQFIQSRLPFYFNTNNITIAYTSAYENGLLTDKAFLARISIVNLRKSESDDYCVFDETEHTWATPPNKYTTKVKCQKHILLQPRHQLYAQVTSLETTGKTDIIDFMDVLRYYVDETLLFPVPFASTGLYAFMAFSNGTNRNLTFEYTSDESLTFQGFSITFKDIECKCNHTKFVIPCFGEQNYSLMANNDYYYCADLLCTFEIVIDESCPTNIIHFKAFTDFDEYYFAHLYLTSDNHYLFNIDGVYKRTYEGRQQSALIFPNRNTSLIFKSSPSEDMRYRSVPIGSVRFWATSFSAPTFLPKQSITIENSLYIFESDKIFANQVLTIELSDELLANDETSEMYFETSNVKHLRHCLTLYSDESMETIITLDLATSSVILNSSITIYKHGQCEHDISKFIIRAKNSQSKSCRFQNNVIKVAEVMKENKVISMISDPTYPCEVTLVNSVEFYVIKKIFVSSKNENVIFYNNQEKNKVILKVNQSISSSWQHMTLNSLSYFIVIPPGSSLLIEFYDPLFSIDITKPISSYYETPYYGTPSFKPISSNTMYKISSNLKTTFKIVDIDLSPSGILQLISSNGSTKNFTAKNEEFAAELKQNETLTIYYKEIEDGFKGALIGIDVEEKSFHPIIT